MSNDSDWDNFGEMKNVHLFSNKTETDLRAKLAAAMEIMQALVHIQPWTIQGRCFYCGATIIDGDHAKHCVFMHASRLVDDSTKEEDVMAVQDHSKTSAMTSPKPWSVTGGRKSVNIVSSDGREIATFVDSEEDAKLICDAVNKYDALMAVVTAAKFLIMDEDNYNFACGGVRMPGTRLLRHSVKHLDQLQEEQKYEQKK